ncbi:MAG: D-alanyl-D-alanine carboxypeptidase, partial [Lachnospiraceae bacterium]|nr:D-alanyl-D-alanine carboxypeptidase [Lachnospiraceae bacterium]
IGGKTGYTRDARQTLVTCAEREGMRLICIIMKEEAPNQFHDTAALLDYGFDGFMKVNISENENRYTLNSATFFHTNLDIMGSSKPILTLNTTDYVIIPKTAAFEDLAVGVSYDNLPAGAVATLQYSYNGQVVGYTAIEYADDTVAPFDFSNIVRYQSRDEIPQKLVPSKNIVFVNIRNIVLILISVLGAILLVFFVRGLVLNYRYKEKYNTLKTVKKRYKKRKKKR